MHLNDPVHRIESENTALTSLGGVQDTILALLEAIQACLACADRCTNEASLPLRPCIRLSLDCAAVCTASVSVLSRSNDADWRVIGAQLQTCLITCDATADLCERLALDHPCCALAAEACRTAERACAGLVEAVPAA